MAIDLGLLLIVNSVSTPEVDNMIEDCKDCFEGLGMMKGKSAKLHVNDSVKPLAHHGPTPCFSPIVVAPWPKNTGIRICVDMRAANQAIECKRHPVRHPVEDLIDYLNGATVFSEIDLRTFALIVSAHPTAHANSHATSCMSARAK